MVMATVLNKEGEELVHNRRMVFAAGTAPDKALRARKKGSEIHVLGIPKIDLALVWFRLKRRAEDASVLKWSFALGNNCSCTFGPLDRFCLL